MCDDSLEESLYIDVIVAEFGEQALIVDEGKSHPRLVYRKKV